MKRYVDAQKKYEADETQLRDMRRRYAGRRSKPLGEEILAAEKALETDLGRLRRLRSDVYRALKQNTKR